MEKEISLSEKIDSIVEEWLKKKRTNAWLILAFNNATRKFIKLLKEEKVFKHYSEIIDKLAGPKLI